MKSRVWIFGAWLAWTVLSRCTLQHPAFGALGDGGDDLSEGPRDAVDESKVCGREGMLCCATGPACLAGAVCAADNLCIVRCPEGQATCGGRCVDRSSDVAHCGACANSCVRAHAASACVAGVCSVGGCDPGFADCDGMSANGCEADLMRSMTHCGACGVGCSFPNAAASCAAGVCVRGACAAGFDDCNADPLDGCEASISTSLAHCGRCGSACAIPMAVSECAMGVCRVNRCGAGTGDCNGSTGDGCETNVTTSLAHCGGCGAVCGFTRATAACMAGVCGMTGCEAGFGNCDMNPGNGCEVTLATNASHCGMCGRRCAPMNAMGACVAGVCGVASCSSNFANCDGMAGNGCEVDTRSNAMHCGMCGRACALANAVSVCSSGRCAVGTCSAGFADCNGDPMDGCETSIRSSAGNCGACGRVCAPANAEGMCASGVCGIGRCRAGFGDCDNSPGNGCEVNLTNSTAHCGTCGSGCSPRNATGACAAGMCVIARCNTGFESCDGAPGNGCEVDTRSAVSHCGGCGMGCMPRLHAAPACASGVCGLTCDSGFGNCNGTVSDGCEADLGSPNSCGACNTRCMVANGTPVCASGRCAVASCNSGFDDCDRRVDTGCEANTRMDLSNCRGCGMVCAVPAATNRCNEGVCEFTCMPGFADCDGTRGNGCEVSINSSLTNCGVCGRVCPTGNGTARCMTGMCRLTCNMGFGDCDMNADNGCETDLRTSATHCGSCGTVCMGAMPMCSSSMCR